jgi:surface polysaccharide O-acyltransferase-like enzyme
VVLGNLLALHRGQAVGSLYDSFGVFTFLVVTALFLWVQNSQKTKEWGTGSRRVIGELAADTLGVYLIHIGLLEGLKLWGLHSMTLPIVIGIPVMALVSSSLGMLVSAILRRIPVVGKYIC